MNEVEQAIFDLINTDATVMTDANGVYYSAAPETAEHPFIIFFKRPLADADIYSFRGRAGRLQEYVVKAVTEGQSKQKAQEMADNVDAILTDSALTMDNWYWRHCHRTGDIEYQETLPTGDVAWHVGGIYELLVAPK